MSGDDSILGEIEDELAELGRDADDVPDRDGVYSPSDDVDSRDPVSMEWPDVNAETRSLTRSEWGIYGEGPPDQWDDMVDMLNSGRLGQLPAEIRPDAPDGWGDAQMPNVRSDQKERGKHLFAYVGATPETMLRVEGQVGENVYGTDRAEFINPVRPKVLDYAERFKDGDRPGQFFAYVTHDGDLQGPQEGRHRAAAAMLAGLDWVPVVVLRETGPTFERWDEDLRTDYEGSRHV